MTFSTFNALKELGFQVRRFGSDIVGLSAFEPADWGQALKLHISPWFYGAIKIYTSITCKKLSEMISHWQQAAASRASNVESHPEYLDIIIFGPEEQFDGDRISIGAIENSANSGELYFRSKFDVSTMESIMTYGLISQSDSLPFLIKMSAYFTMTNRLDAAKTIADQYMNHPKRITVTEFDVRFFGTMGIPGYDPDMPLPADL